MSQTPSNERPPISEPTPSAQPVSAYPTPGPEAVDPGKTLGVVGLVLAFVASFVGLIISIIALRKSKKAGFKNGIALAGVIVGVVTTIGSLIAAGVLIYATTTVLDKCAELGSGTHQVDGVTVTCP